MRKRVVSLLLAVCMVLSLVPVTAFAEDGTTASTPFTLQVSSDGEKVTLPLTKEDRKVTFTAETFGADALGFAPAQGDTADTAYSAVYPQGSKAVVFTAESGFSVWTAEGDYLDGTGLGGGSAAILLQETEYYVLGDVGEGCYYALYLNEEKAVEQGPDLADGYYQLASADDLTWFAEQVSGGETTIKGKLTAGIDMSEVTGFTGIGTEANAFAGELDGNGKTVTVKMNVEGNFGTNNRAGLVAFADGAEIHDVTMAGDIEAYNGAGLVGCTIGDGETVIKNCVNQAAMRGSNPVGGILGEAKGKVTIRGCVNEGVLGFASFEGTSDSGNNGGIVGRITAADCLIEGCENSGEMLTAGAAGGAVRVGGIVGSVTGKNCVVKQCFNTG